MNSAKTYLIGLLALTTAGGAWFAWRQHHELLELRNAAMNREERADLQKKVWELQRANQALEARLAGQRGRSSGPGDPGPSEPRPPRADGPGGRAANLLNPGGALRDLMNKPEFQALQAAQRRARIEQTYSALFRTLNLSPDQAQKLTAILADRQNTRQDVVEAARSQGIDPRENPETFQKLLENARNELNASIRGVVGDAGLTALQAYEQTLPQRNLVQEMQQRLAYSGNNLSLEQENQLVQIFAATQPAPLTPPGGSGSRGGAVALADLAPAGARTADLGGMIGAMFGTGGAGAEFEGLLRVASGGVPITSQAITQAQGILTAPQLTVLQQLQQQQQAQQQMQQIMTETLLNRRPGPPQPRKSDGK